MPTAVRRRQDQRLGYLACETAPSGARTTRRNVDAMTAPDRPADSVDPRYGGYYSFSCVIDRRQRY